MVNEGISSYYDSNVGLEFIDELVVTHLIFEFRVEKIAIGYTVNNVVRKEHWKGYLIT